MRIGTLDGYTRHWLLKGLLRVSTGLSTSASESFDVIAGFGSHLAFAAAVAYPLADCLECCLVHASPLVNRLQVGDVIDNIIVGNGG